MNKRMNYSRQQLQAIKASYHRVSPNKGSAINLNIGQNDILKVCVRKRTKKHKLLMQLAILGFIAWGVLLLVSYIIDNQNGGKQANGRPHNLSIISTKTNMLQLSDLNLVPSTKPSSGPFRQANTLSSVKELTQQLQRIRMHNILRTSNWVNPIASSDASASALSSQAFVAISVQQVNLQQNLVQAWEKEFLSIKN